MKKFLSLVLALVMTMSLVTVSAGAKDFTDGSKVQYTEAVDVMSTLGVVGGYTDGAFNPASTLTRGAAAKIICNVILGTTAAGALVADAAPYKDVPVTNTFAGYIAYCAKEGIISGYADGTFRPAGTLTGYAFMKMLLGALGLDSKVEGYTGANWSIAVAKRALSDGVDLTDGLNGDFNGVKAVTREEACLYAFNMLKAGKFHYDNSSTITVGNIVIKNNSKAEQDEVTGDTLQNAYFQSTFTKLKANTNKKDDLNRPATQWRYDGKEIGTYAKTPDAQYTAKVKSKDLYSDLDLSKDFAVGSIEYYVDGEDATSPYAITKNGAQKDKKFGGNGVTLEAYTKKDSSGDVSKIVLVYINTYYGEIDDVTTNNDKERIVKIGSKEYVTSEFSEDDSVIYTMDADGTNADAIQSMAAVEKKTGELTKISGSDYTIGGTTYTLNANCDDKGDYDVKDDVDFYLDANGYIIHIESADEEANVDNLAYVVEATSSRGDYAVLRLADGSKKTVDTDKNYQSLEGHIVTFKENKDGYKLTDKSGSTYTNAGNGDLADTDFSVKFEKGKPSVAITGKTGFKTDSKTVFVYATRDASNDYSYKAYTGYKNAPSILTVSGGSKVAAGVETISAYVKDGVAVFVYVDMPKASVGTSSADMTFVAYDDGANYVDEGDGVRYYELNAVVDGKVTTVKVDTTVYAQIASDATADELVAAYDGLTYDSDDIAYSFTVASLAQNGDVTVKALKNDMIQVNGQAYAFTDDAQVFFVDGCDITEGKTSDIREDNNGTKNPYKQVLAHLDDGDIDIIVLVKD